MAIANMAKPYDITLWVISALQLCFSLMGVGPVPILLLVAAEVLIIGCHIFNLAKYQKQM